MLWISEIYYSVSGFYSRGWTTIRQLPLFRCTLSPIQGITCDQTLENSLFFLFRKAGLYTATISSFAERHSSYWFNAGFCEVINCGKRDEAADEVHGLTLDWIKQNKDREDGFLHVNMWDAHTPYRAPQEWGNPYADEPIPEWITEDVFAKQKQHVGPQMKLQQESR